MRVITVVLSYGEKKHLEECLSSLRNQECPDLDHDIIVIDNKLENLGFTGGNNKGISIALSRGADAVFLLNDDTKVDKRAVCNLYHAMSRDRNIGVAVPKIYFYPGFEFHKTRYQKTDTGRVLWYAGGRIDWKNILGIHRGVDDVDVGQYDRADDIEFATGCAMMIRRDAIGRVGLLDHRYFLYLEDLDYSVRARRAGYAIRYVPSAVVWHKNAQSSGVGSGLQDYYFTRNRLLFGMTYAPFRTKFALVREALKLLVQGPALKRRGVMDWFLGNYGEMVI